MSSEQKLVELRMFLASVEAERIRLRDKELEALKALLLLEQQSGTMAHIYRVLYDLPVTISKFRIQLERRIRRFAGSKFRAFIRRTRSALRKVETYVLEFF